MSYTPHEWQNDELITAAKMNNIEEGIAEGGSGGWDAVIRLTHSNDSGADTQGNLTPSIVSGSFADLYAKCDDGKCPCILVEYYHPLGGQYSAPMGYIVYFGSTILIKIAGFSALSNGFINFGMLAWADDDDIGWD